VDAITGPAIGRPKTGTFRLGDLVGHDTSVNVINGLRNNCPNDEQVASFTIPPYLQFLVDNKFLGNKSGQGFYKKTTEKDSKGKPVVLSLDLNMLEYAPSKRSTLPSLNLAKQIEELPNRVRALSKSPDKGGELVKKSLSALFAYVSNRIPEISDNTYSIDDAMRAGYAWEAGPFEYWDMIGIANGIANAEAQGEHVADWVKEMVAAGHTSFYKSEGGIRKFYDVATKSYQVYHIR
jgi:3-hydroxyacyl-CoA dehydrogenase